MNTRGARGKRVKIEKQQDSEYEINSICSSSNEVNEDPEEAEEVRKSKIRDNNKEYARRMTILQSWSNYWLDYTTRQGDAYPPSKAREILKKSKKITCPIESCNKTFTTYPGLKYHYARCNIERCFKCNVCEPSFEVSTKGELLKHMILFHYNKLPELDPEQKEIASSFFAGENRADKHRKEKFLGDNEQPFNPSKLVRAFRSLQDRVFQANNFTDRPYKHWPSALSDWEPLSHEFDKNRFYPPEFYSVKFRTSKSSQAQQDAENNRNNWYSLRAGDSINLKIDKENTSSTSIFYTGGINTASAWLPKSPHDHEELNQEILAVAIDCNSLDQSKTYRQSHRGEACVQFWKFDLASYSTSSPSIKTNSSVGSKLTLAYMMAHQYGTIFDMIWCPLGASWESRITLEDKSVHGRLGLLALACGDGQIRIVSVPHTQDLITRCNNRISETMMDATPIYKAKPVATLMHPGVGQSTDNQPVVCRTIDWSLESNQRYIAAGYTNGTVALFDLQNTSPIIYSNVNACHVHQPLKSCIAHGAPVTGIAISLTLSSTPCKTEDSNDGLDRILIASGSTDRLLRIWHVIHDNCLNSERAPITKILWDYRFRGIITACDTAFTSFNNRVSYRCPSVDGHQNVTISTHHSIVWGLANSIITNSIATSDGAGEVFVMPQTFNRLSHKRDRSLLNIHSLYTLLPKALESNIGSDSKNGLQGEALGNEIYTSLKFSQPSILPDLIENNNYDIDDDNIENIDAQSSFRADADFSAIERPVANKPTKFLLPKSHEPIETYSRFKTKFGLEFIEYNQLVDNKSGKSNSKVSESCARAGNLQDIYCDRACDYPFSSINNVIWSPNVKTFPFLLSTTHIGLCRLDKVQVVDQMYRHFIDTILLGK